MSPSELNLLHALHVFSVVVLVAYTFYAFAAPPETRKGVMIVTGIASLVLLLTGGRMWHGMFGLAFMGWIIVKLVCWLGVSAFVGMAYRKREKARLFMSLALLFVAIALVMVYWKPTF